LGALAGDAFRAVPEELLAPLNQNGSAHTAGELAADLVGLVVGEHAEAYRARRTPGVRSVGRVCQGCRGAPDAAGCVMRSRLAATHTPRSFTTELAHRFHEVWLSLVKVRS
jgi:hypothetical protein